MPLPHQRTRFEIELNRVNDGLKTTICCLRRELEIKQTYAARLEYLLHERLTRIDDLNGRIDQLRNRKLNAECERLAEIVRPEG